VGFVTQSFFIGVGATLANGLPYLFRRLGVTGSTESGIPFTVQYSFKIGACVFLLAVLWTVITSKEYPPDDLEAFRKRRSAQRGLFAWLREIISAIREMLREIVSAIREMPLTMKQLAVVQVFTWLGLFCMWMFFGLMTARHVFGAP